MLIKMMLKKVKMTIMPILSDIGQSHCSGHTAHLTLLVIMVLRMRISMTIVPMLLAMKLGECQYFYVVSCQRT